MRLGLRLYFIAVLGKGQEQSYRPELLAQSVRKARRLLAGDGEPGDLPDFVRRHGGPHGYVDPYRVITAMLSPHPRARARGLALRVLS